MSDKDTLDWELQIISIVGNKSFVKEKPSEFMSNKDTFDSKWSYFDSLVFAGKQANALVCVVSLYMYVKFNSFHVQHDKYCTSSLTNILSTSISCSLFN